MFLNLSNHPSDKWTERQREAALAISRKLNDGLDEEDIFIEDMPFPNIPPNADSEKVAYIVDDFYRKINNECVAELTAVHIMGEMTFVYMLVQKLQKRGFACYAGTSERKTIDHADGTKTVVFDFVQFSAYSSQN